MIPLTGNIWITADLHLGHATILQYDRRPWDNIDKHDNALIGNIKKLVSPEDTLIINGDLCIFGSDQAHRIRAFVDRIPGKKILVYGNHDHLHPMKYIEMGFSLATTALVLPGNVLMAHDPAWAETWPVDQPMLCGHVHGLFRCLRNVVNVGVDVREYRPVLLSDMIEEAKISMKMYEDSRSIWYPVKETKPGDVDWKKVSENRHER